MGLLEEASRWNVHRPVSRARMLADWGDDMRRADALETRAALTRSELQPTGGTSAWGVALVRHVLEQLRWDVACSRHNGGLVIFGVKTFPASLLSAASEELAANMALASMAERPVAAALGAMGLRLRVCLDACSAPNDWARCPTFGLEVWEQWEETARVFAVKGERLHPGNVTPFMHLDRANPQVWCRACGAQTGVLV